MWKNTKRCLNSETDDEDIKQKQQMFSELVRNINEAVGMPCEKIIPAL